LGTKKDIKSTNEPKFGGQNIGDKYLGLNWIDGSEET
jgi:hypothetical protein